MPRKKNPRPGDRVKILVGEHAGTTGIMGEPFTNHGSRRDLDQMKKVHSVYQINEDGQRRYSYIGGAYIPSELEKLPGENVFDLIEQQAAQEKIDKNKAVRKERAEAALVVLNGMTQEQKDEIVIGVLMQRAAKISWFTAIDNAIIENRLTQLGFKKGKETKISDRWVSPSGEETFLRKEIDGTIYGKSPWVQSFENTIEVIAKVAKTSTPYEYARFLCKQWEMDRRGKL